MQGKLLEIFLPLLMIVPLFWNISVAQAQEDGNAVEVTFSDLGYSDLRLKGLYGTNSMWIPFQSDWPVGPVEVNLTYTASPLLNSEQAILTVLAENQELVSVRPIADGLDHSISFVVPPERQLAAGINITFDGHLKLTDEICEDSFNVGQWLIIRDTSQIRINLSGEDRAPEITDLPQAIVVEGGDINLPPVLFVLPDQLDDVALTTAAQVAMRLGARINAENLPVNVTTASTLTEEQRLNSNLVVIGLPSNQPLIQELAGGMPVPPLNEGFISLDGIPIPATDGVIQIFSSPWRPSNRVLLIGGNGPEGLAKAGAAFEDEATFESLSGAFQFVHELVVRPEDTQSPAWTTPQTTFAQLGEFDRQVTGLGITDSFYFFRLPPGSALGQDAQLVLHIAFSPALRNKNSFAAVYVNDIYSGSINVDSLDGDSWVALNLPIQSLNELARKGSPRNLNIKLSIANLLPNNNCDQVDKNSSWTKIYADSYITGNFVPVEQPDLYYFPYPFASLANENPVRLIVADEPTVGDIQAALSIAAMLGSGSTPNLQLDMRHVSTETPESLSGRNLIMIGTPSRHVLLKEVLAATQANIPLDIYQVLSAQRTGVFHVLKSPWDDQRSVLAIYSESDAGLDAALQSLYERANLTDESGSIALVKADEVPVQPIVVYREAGLAQPQIVNPEIIVSEIDPQQSSSAETPVAGGTPSENTAPTATPGGAGNITGTERLILIVTVFLVILVAVGALVRVAWRIRS